LWWTCGAFSLLAASVGAQPSQAGDEQRIREARDRSNAAIAAHDTAAMARLWMEDLHVVASTSDQIAGRAENARRFAQQFASRPDLIYVRRPTTVEVFAPWDVAAERGEWTGRWTDAAGVVEIGGTYLAQWRKVGGEWFIRAEVYVPLRCTGHPYCSRRP
jgi:ketosteroid isomerase-like protein